MSRRRFGRDGPHREVADPIYLLFVATDAASS
jgi:hypothetical protein